MSRNWKPVRKGGIYCSSACGHDCTHAAYLAAHKAARKAIKQLQTTGWEAHVWENMGWHWALTNKLCGISLHTFYYGSRPVQFWCMMGAGDVTDVTNGSCVFDIPDYLFDDPNDAVDCAIKAVVPWFKAQIRGYTNLQRISSTRKILL